ncbi:hypothetical protein ATL41_1179 [Flavimobilis soli]|uniref:Uncharacterized protein n=1 Tax=Flavimobilis soli TaxID=442709 RepID=A0A2A9ECD4_9MICO|nr:hypothetical protein [Flavimobilis soli]PFG36453.1 hypothetical protein ATL41_1179 [Flavimobilis soli]
MHDDDSDAGDGQRKGAGDGQRDDACRDAARSDGARPDRARPDEEGQTPLNLWAGVARRPLPRSDGPVPPRSHFPPTPVGPPVGPPPPPGSAARPSGPPGRPEVPDAPHRQATWDAAHLSAPAGPTSSGAPAPARRRRRVVAIVAAGALVIAAALVVPDLLNGAGDPEKTAPPAPRLTVPPVTPSADPEALRPDFLVANDIAADLPLPEPLDGDVPPAAATGKISWRLTEKKLARIWADGWGDGSPWDGVAPEDIRRIAELPAQDAAHQANLADVVLMTVSAYGPDLQVNERRMLLAVGAQDGEVAWTRPFSSQGRPVCQLTGRGANLVCTNLTDGDERSARIYVYDGTSGEDVASVTVDGCRPTQFLQAGTSLYWAGLTSEGDAACLGGGEALLARIPLSERLESLPPDALTLNVTGPLLRTRDGSVMLTPDGWRGYTGRVEPGPGSVVVREISTKVLDAVQEPSEVTTTFVTTYDGDPLWDAPGRAWRRLDLMPDSAVDERMMDAVGAGLAVCAPDGTVLARLQDDEGRDVATGPDLIDLVATPDGLWARTPVGTQDLDPQQAARWTWDGVFDGPETVDVPTPATPRTVVGDATLFEDEVSSGIVFADRSSERVLARSGALRTAKVDIPYETAQATTLWAAPPDVTSGPSIELVVGEPRTAALVGRVLVAPVDGGLVGYL